MKPVTLCHDYPYAPERVWQLATDYGALAQVMEGVVSFKGLPDGRVYTGQNISVMVSLFGKLPAQPYSMEVLDCDDTNMVLRSSEKGAGVKSWRHTLRVVETEIECQLIDRIEIDAGLLTPVFRQWANYLYKARHKPRLRLLQSGAF